VVHPSFDIPYVNRFSAHADTGCARPQGRPCSPSSHRRQNGFTHGRERVKGQCPLTGRTRVGQPAYAGVKNPETGSQENKGGSLPRFPLDSSPPPISQLRRWIGFGVSAGATLPLALRRYPSYPIDGEGGFRPAPSTKVRPPALYAATKGNTGAATAPVFLWMSFPHPGWLRRWCVRSALSGARRQHRPLARPTNCA
jgi:hypothetical protein